ncbi:BREX-2 system adenine-specific DNA-methyltransferase PglX [Kitasatospora sp. NPDC101235]|uniref:BREX-2 system adenine-specific DNA-methyltransferase PglX n=1 Tax=Kitasatospora sp. NPDC101235 TaxID=3364101 RepID=UPI00382E69E8
MIERKSLLADLQQQVKAAETDLDAQVKAVPEVSARLRGEYEQARKASRTAATWSAWLGERVTQVAVAWVLGTVFVRFSEDNELIAEPYITAPTVAGRDVAQARYEEYVDKDDDPTYRGWLETAFAELGAGPAGQLLFDQRHNPLFQIPLSHEGAGALLEFWRRENGGDGTLVHDFTDPLEEGGDGTKGWDTRFLGDLYQDLSEAARKTYALLQTPEFVEEFILDRTMKPAVREFGFEGLKMIDPTCGSGHFVLGAFRRLVRLWAEERPAVGPYERVRAALESVHGVDLNPFAVAIARFRLLLAAMAAGEMRTFAEASAYDWPMRLAVGDSLLPTEFRQEGLFEVPGASGESAEDPYYALSTEDVFEHPEILRKGRYHVVVGNPPYITVKDKTLNERYRKLYDACAGTYALSVPFAQRFFELAVRGDDPKSGRGYGMVGQITANSFMKREFGTRLIEEFFAHKVELTEVIDTSGAYIPGHGTPTVILVGRPRNGSGRQATIRTVRSVQGEPAAPEKAEEGFVWRAIVEQIDQPGNAGQWVSVDDLGRGRYFAKQPWILAAGGLEMVESINLAGNVGKLEAICDSIGFNTVTREDDAYMLGFASANRLGVSPDRIRTFHGGGSIRDWTKTDGVGTIFPYTDSTHAAEIGESTERLLWPNRTLLRRRKALSGTQEEQGLTWFEYSSFNPRRYWSTFLIPFSFVATHCHFMLRRDNDGFIRSAPVIKLREGATEEEHLALLGVLNSSTAGFWLKMVSHDKGSQSGTGGFMHDEWERFYEFTGTKLQEFPLPAAYPVSLATALDALAQQLTAASPSALAARETPTPATLRDARTRYDAIRARMIALQEELDWQVYGLYQLHTDELWIPEAATDPETAAVPSLALGERAFEIVLARRVETGETSEVWFARHGSTPITTIPDHWPAPYRALVQKRIDAIEANRALNMIERPEYKRRWATDGWDAMQGRALKAWLLDRVEDRRYWFDQEGNPTMVSLSRLTEDLSTDAEFVSVAEIYAPRQDFAKTVRELLSDEHVPFVSALRYKPSGLKKRADWEHVWDLQREEDAAPDEPARRKVRERTPVPPKYTSADFLKPSYWRARGKLDVPKERFVSYGSANVQQPALYGWAGWNQLEQALALASYVQDAGAGFESADLVPYLAGLLELQPWLDQWYGEYDPDYGAAPAAEILGFRHLKQGELGLTDEDLRSWKPVAAKRGGRTATVKSDS